MGAQAIGPRKTRQAAQATGLAIERLIRLDNRVWEARVPTDDGFHAHYSIDPKTWDYAVSDGPCWTTCETPRRGAVMPYAWTPAGSLT